MNEQHTAVPPYTPQSSTVTIIEHMSIFSYIIEFYLTSRSPLCNTIDRIRKPFIKTLLPLR